MRVILALLLAAIPVLPAAAREAIGVYKGWGAFRDAAPRRCYAIAEPLRPPTAPASGAFASIARWPGRGLTTTLHVRLRRERSPAAAVTLSVGERRFALVARGRDAWAPDTPSDRAIVAAMRTARRMSVETAVAPGRALVDVYALDGAATAIDAATLACRATR